MSYLFYLCVCFMLSQLIAALSAGYGLIITYISSTGQYD
ncbi:hypothetical protein CLOBOL_01275 [Enterocloster bolteae ATCC BAA-613]|uniref:Uncharacterized protein n=1 Tax=Enterocloster bolteae (strain ATCC BAA-613 / DSM 15670 / CCUG 46953 / JCM 12243 / WAL 16351) TaxID=411902 RepID=A8RKD1_ENTBW|nr:hypothetical protein CLOBOL_01275 [Enterocloster bolteae ATCC BAA-613]